MRLLKKAEELAGVPLHKLRPMLQCQCLLEEHLAAGLGLGQRRTRQLRQALVAEGYLVASRWPGAWEVTPEGHRLGQAGLRRYRRRSVSRVLLGLLDRADAINQSEEDLVWVDTLGVFGSYLDPDRRDLGDLDVALRLSWRVDAYDEFVRLSREMWEQDREAGRNVTYYPSWWPDTRVRLALKARSPILSLTSWDSLKALEAEPVTVYDRHRPEVAEAVRGSVSKHGRLPE